MEHILERFLKSLKPIMLLEIPMNMVRDLHSRFFIIFIGLSIGESTFGGLVQLTCTRRTGLMDYGSLIWVTLQRARNASQAIEVLTNLVETYGTDSHFHQFIPLQVMPPLERVSQSLIQMKCGYWN